MSHGDTAQPFQFQINMSKKGGISFLTHDVISRIDLTRGAFIMALTQFVNEKWNDKK